jgi:hypothetical protein
VGSSLVPLGVWDEDKVLSRLKKKKKLTQGVKTATKNKNKAQGNFFLAIYTSLLADN